MKPGEPVGEGGRPPSNSTLRRQKIVSIRPAAFLLNDGTPPPPPKKKRRRTVVTTIRPAGEWLPRGDGGGGAEFRGGGGKENAAPNSPRRRPLDGRADGDGAVDSGAERREDAALDGDAQGGKASVGQGQNDRDEQQRSLDESWDTPAGDAGHHPARKDDEGKDGEVESELLGEQEDVDFGDAGGGEEAVSEGQGALDEEASRDDTEHRDGLDGKAKGHDALNEPRAGQVADAASPACKLTCKRLCKQPVGQLFAHAEGVRSRSEGASTPVLVEEATGEQHPSARRSEDVEVEVREAIAKCVAAVEEKTGEPSASPFVQSGDGSSNSRDGDVHVDVHGRLPAQMGDGGQQDETRREENVCQYRGSGCRGHYQYYDNFHLSRCDGCTLLTCDTCALPCSGGGCPCTLCERCMYEGGDMCPDCRDGIGPEERECEDESNTVLCYGCDRGACCNLASIHESSDCYQEPSPASDTPVDTSNTALDDSTDHSDEREASDAREREDKPVRRSPVRRSPCLKAHEKKSSEEGKSDASNAREREDELEEGRSADNGDGNDHSYDGEKESGRKPLHEGLESGKDSFIVRMREAVLQRRLHTKEFAEEAEKLLSEWGEKYPRLARLIQTLLQDSDHHASGASSSEPSGDTASNESGEGTDSDESEGGTESDDGTESESDESGESNGEDDASANSSNDGYDYAKFHPGQLELVPPIFVLRVNGKKINSRHYKLMPGWCRFEIVCLDKMEEFDFAKKGWTEEIGKSIFDAMTADGYVFMTVDKNNQYVPMEGPDPELTFDAWVATRPCLKYDDKSYRKCICKKLDSLKASDAQRKVKDDAESRMKCDFEDARGSPSLGVYNYDTDSDAHPRNPGQDPNVKDAQYAQCRKEMEEEIEKQSSQRGSSTETNARSCSCGERSCDHESCGVDMTWKVLRRCPEFFEYALEKEELWEEKGEQPELDDVVKEIKRCNFKCFEGMTDEEILLSLLNPDTKVRGRRGTLQQRWDRSGNWRQMFGDIVSGIERRLCDECYCCGRSMRGYPKASHAYGFHKDHLLKFWKKDNECSQLKGSIARMLLESLKTRLVCGFCHENGKIPGYERHLKYVCKLAYDFRTGDDITHRSASEALDLLEMKCFILELKSRGAFFTGKDPKMTWRTLEFLVWKYFRVILSDVVYFTEDDWANRNRKERGRLIPNTVIMNLLKKLGVRCEGCDEDFSNHIPARMSGIHMDHRGRKTNGPSDCLVLYVDVLIEELRQGNCNPLCCFCHGYKTF